MRRIGIIIGFGISAACVWLVLRNIDFSQLGDSLANALLGWVLLSAGCSVLQMWIRSQRWQRILKASREVPRNIAFKSYMVGQMANMVLPFRAGELIRVLALGELIHVSKSASLASVVTERILDLFSLLLMLAITLLISPLPAWIIHSAWAVMFLATGATILLLLMKKLKTNLISILSRFDKYLPDKITGKLTEFFDSFLSGIKGLGSIGQYVWLIVETVLIWVLAGLGIYFLFLAFGMAETYNLKFLAVLTMIVMTALGVSVPSSPGFVGTMHLAIIMGLGLFGIAKEEALGYAVVLHFVSVVVIVSMGIISLKGGMISFGSLYKTTKE